jgi:hypothetical protein
VLRGLTTLIQLVEPAPDGFRFAGVRIEDRPRYAWRGLMIDTARHFMTLDALKRQVDAMELVKLNVLHLHLSDNEGFRVESKLFPGLQKTSDGYYTQAEMRDLIAYAADRDVRVVPEFDAPGHARSWLKAYPQLGPVLEPAPGAVTMNDTLDPSREEIYAFVSKLYGEMSRLFTDRYFHVGGDEVNGVDWDASPAVRQFRTTSGLAHVFEPRENEDRPRTLRQLLERDNHGPKCLTPLEDLAHIAGHRGMKRLVIHVLPADGAGFLHAIQVAGDIGGDSEEVAVRSADLGGKAVAAREAHEHLLHRIFVIGRLDPLALEIAQQRKPVLTRQLLHNLEVGPWIGRPARFTHNRLHHSSQVRPPPAARPS